MLTQQLSNIFEIEYFPNDLIDQCCSKIFLISFFEFYSRVTSGFLMQAADFLELFPSFRRIPVFEVAILSYNQKVRIFEMPPIQFLIYKIKASFVPNWKPLRVTFCKTDTPEIHDPP